MSTRIHHIELQKETHILIHYIDSALQTFTETYLTEQVLQKLSIRSYTTLSNTFFVILEELDHSSDFFQLEIVQKTLARLLGGDLQAALATLQINVQHHAKTELALLHLLKARLHRLNKEYDETMEAYNHALVLQEDYSLCFEIADCAQEQQQKTTAITYLKKAIELSHRPHIQIEAIWRLIRLLDLEQEFIESKKYRLEALSIYNKKVKNQKHSALDAEVRTYLALIETHFLNYKQALIFYQECLKIYQRLADKNLEQYAPAIATTLEALAKLNTQLHQHSPFENYQSRALEIYKQLAKKNPKQYTAKLAQASVQLALDLLHRPDQFDQAVQLMDEALSLYQQLSTENELYYYEDYPRVLRYLGKLKTLAHEYNLAEDYYIQALKIYADYTLDDTHLWSDKVELYLALSHFYTETKELDQTEYYLEKALKIQRILIQKYPKKLDYSSKLSQILDTLGLHYTPKNIETAKIYLDEAIEIGTRLTLKQAEVYQVKLINPILHLSQLFYQENNFLRAQTHYDNVLVIAKQVALRTPLAVLPHLGEILYHGVELFIQQKQVTKAKHACHEAIDIYTKLASVSPKVYNLGLGKTQIQMGYLYQKILPKKKLSIEVTQAGLNNLKTLGNIPKIQKIFLKGLNILKEWKVDANDFAAFLFASE
ncbi:MAG: tetratricopeptide repeat protein [Saprospiraceae bacterium]|nr:tetratricopeptide repeat protein [Saprospiraceae bacterium]